MDPDGISPIILSKCASGALYRPFYHLFSLILRYSYLPRDWKIHKIVPVFKSEDATQVKNYRPISLLCMIKVLERIIYNKLINRISCQINPAQFGFMQNQSTTHVQKLLMSLSNAFTVYRQLDILFVILTCFKSCPCIIYLAIYGSGSKNYLTNRF